MKIETRRSYHPIVPFAFQLSLLPTSGLKLIPRSTRSYWKKRNSKQLYDADMYKENKEIFNLLQAIVLNKKLLAFNKALIRCIAIKRFIHQYARQVSQRNGAILQALIGSLQKITVVTGHARALKLAGISYTQWLQWKNIGTCSRSAINRCRRKHPTQLLTKEIEMLTKLCSDEAYQPWPLSSIYHLAVNQQLLSCSLASFYKYAALLANRLPLPHNRRKNHTQGIRAGQPLQLLHTDITQFVTEDNHKAFIYLVQDNFSRSVLCYKVAVDRKAIHTLELIREAISMRGNSTQTIQLITDDGIENRSIKKEMAGTDTPLIHLVAQKDISFSNSMIEYLNRTLKYRYLYQKSIKNITQLETELSKAVNDYNNRPAHTLNGLTPLQALNSVKADTLSRTKQIQGARLARIAANKIAGCCSDL